MFVLLLSSNNSFSKTSAQEIQLNLRKIGHEFLMQLHDSTSRVMPIKKEGDRYAVYFENPMEFRPSALVFATEKVLYQEKTNERYFVEVETCDSTNIVYSFEWVPNQDLYSVACQQRPLPRDCYVFYFTVDAHETAASSKEEASTNYLWIIVLGGSLFIMVILIWFIRRKKASEKLTHFIPIGQFQFDLKEMTLNMAAQSIQLSAKEADLLRLLHENENETVKREDILREVWGDEGDYVGRTLDVFISKLRKKLQADPNLKIINIRGVGYRFVMTT
jgi:hypothetical protein